MTTLPVLGVPVESRALQGLDSLLSIVQMPGGVPVGTLAIGARRRDQRRAARRGDPGAAATTQLAARAGRLARGAQTAAVAETPADHGEGGE